MTYQYKELALGRWQKFSLIEQMANIGSEVERAIKWKEKGNKEYSEMAFFRALELIDMAVEDPKNRLRLTEVMRVREVLADYFVFNNEYHSTAEEWRKYFYAFNYAARIK